MIEEVTMYRVVCDWPGCEAIPDGEYYAWADRDQAIQETEYAEWWTNKNADEPGTFCPDHPMAWASDHENGEPYPDPPYLLIHDGDTGNPDDDGHVSLIGGESGGE